jgi:glycosyltransferase involved in cell wall biosynthesis
VGVTPEIAVVVPSHDRPLRLRWLLNALEEQTLARDRFEVVVCHDSAGPETDRLLAEHPLAGAGLLHAVRLPAGTAPPGRNRNAAWRSARAPLIAFTDDDCRPPADWLEAALAAARRHPGAIVQGATEPDPEEEHLLRAPHARTQRVVPPSPYAEACNIIYPRELLERLGGFDEQMRAGEDAELAWGAAEAGATRVAAPEVLTWHGVDTPWLGSRLRSTWRWRDLPKLIGRHPGHREAYPLGLFWKRTHAWLPVALAGAALARRRNAAYAGLALPWVACTLPFYGAHARARLRSVSELPARAAIDVTELAALVWGSARHRTLFL